MKGKGGGKGKGESWFASLRYVGLGRGAEARKNAGPVVWLEVGD